MNEKKLKKKIVLESHVEIIVALREIENELIKIKKISEDLVQNDKVTTSIDGGRS